MNKRGFTLVELLAVLVILSVIALIAVPTVTKSVKNARENAYNTSITNIKLAMQSWKNEHSNMLPKRGEKIYLTIAGLKHDSYLEQELKNPKTGLPFPNDTLLYIDNDSSGYHYVVDITTGTETEDYDGSTPYLEMASIKRHIKEGSEYVPSTVYAYHGNGEVSNATIETSYIDNAIVDANTPGTYYVLYTATIDNIPVSLVETIVVDSISAVCTGTSITTPNTYSVGDIYTCNPGDGVARTFYLLKIQTDSVSFIMDKNIGTNVAWDESNTIINGPESAVAYLKRVTKKWNNVAVSLPNGSDIAIAGGDSAWNNTKVSETLSGWLYSNLNCAVNTCTEEVDSSDTGTTLGYWTTTNYDLTKAYQVEYSGKLNYNHTITDDTYYGVRPVITVSKDLITN